VFWTLEIPFKTGFTVFGLKRDEVTGGWRKLHNEELHNLYSSNIIIMIKSRKVGWAGHVARMGQRGMHMGYGWMDNIKMDLREVGWGMVWTGFIWLRIGTSERLL
jgi:hypothetical protein